MRRQIIILKARPHCKINLGLHVVGRRPDGYHNLETIFIPIHAISDSIEIVESDAPRMIQQGIELDNAPEDNLCMKAWQLMHDRFGVPPVTIRLKKGIPSGAGLGGGSSDAAFTLKMLNKKYVQVDNRTLKELAVQLGADCPFFLGDNIAYATGIGERLHKCPEPNLAGYRIVIEMPDGEQVSTKEAYAGLNPDLFSRKRPKLREAVLHPVEEWKSLIVNDFEASVFPLHPAIAALKEDMYRRGAVYASMTGSGAAVFGIFKCS